MRTDTWFRRRTFIGRPPARRSCGGREPHEVAERGRCNRSVADERREERPARALLEGERGLLVADQMARGEERRDDRLPRRAAALELPRCRLEEQRRLGDVAERVRERARVVLGARALRRREPRETPLEPIERAAEDPARAVERAMAARADRVRRA